MKNHQQINPKLQQTFTTLRENGIFPAMTGKIFQHRLLDFIHTNAMNHIQTKQLSTKMWKNVSNI